MELTSRSIPRAGGPSEPEDGRHWKALRYAAANSVEPKDYRFRLYLNPETGDERYKGLNTAMWVASAARLGSWIVYDAYGIL